MTAEAAVPRSVRLVELPSTAMIALLAGDLAGASKEVGVELTDYFLGDDAQWLWQYRVDQLAADPSSVGWLVKVVVAEPAGVVVGHAGFHGPPDESGMVEVGYSVDPAHRRQGYARATLAALLERASAEPDVRTVRASISPTNAASLATIAGFGFLEVGDQWDERDGLELLFDLPRLGGLATNRPSSNLQTGAADSISQHPIGLLAKLKFRVTVNTDNRLMSGTSMSRELTLLAEAFDYGLPDFRWFAINAMKSAFLPFDERLAIIENVIKPWYAEAI